MPRTTKPSVKTAPAKAAKGKAATVKARQARSAASKAATRATKPAPTPTDRAARAALPETPLVQTGLPNLAPEQNVSNYRGAVPMKAFVGWVLLVVLAVTLGGLLAAHLLVSQRLGQLVDDTATRVSLQAQNRAALVAEWANGVTQLAETTAGSETLRLFMADRTGANLDPLTALAVRAQRPYMQRLLDDFIQRHGYVGAHLLRPSGDVVLSSGQLPTNLSAALPELAVLGRTGQGLMLPVRLASQPGEGGQPVMDILRPILALGGNASLGDERILGVLWVTAPVGAPLAELVAASPLDRPGERTALVQSSLGEDAEAQVIGRTGLADLQTSLRNLQSRTEGGRVVLRSVIDGTPVFATLTPVAGTPLALLQEYRADQALSLMDVYKPGLYAVVALLATALGALMLALTLHLMSQRNTTRVRLLGQTMEALVRVVEARDPYLAGHHMKVARLALKIGNAMNLSVGERATLFYAAQLSAVGRMLVPQDIMAKKGAHTPKEKAELHAHVTQAQQILGELDFDLPIVPVIAQLYERVDGSGYPLGLRGHQMHRMAKVLGAADAYTAMTNARAHRPALPRAEAFKQLESGAYDSAVVKALKAVTR